MIDKDDKDYIDSNFNRLSLSDMYACKLQVRGGLGGSTNWLSITNEQAKAVHAILAGDRVLGHNPQTHVVITWCIDDVKTMQPYLNDEQAMAVLNYAVKNHDANNGISYEVLEAVIDKLAETPASFEEDVPQ